MVFHLIRGELKLQVVDKSISRAITIFISRLVIQITKNQITIIKRLPIITKSQVITLLQATIITVSQVTADLKVRVAEEV